MFKLIITLSLAVLLLWGTLADFNPALACRGGDDSRESSDDGRRGRGRGQDDVLEGQRRREGEKGQHHLLEDQDQRRGRGRDDLNRPFPDDSGGRGRGRDDR